MEERLSPLVHQVLIWNGHVNKAAGSGRYQAICGAWFLFNENKGPLTCLECLALMEPRATKA